jgi:CheY-like chemotaxis protein
MNEHNIDAHHGEVALVVDDSITARMIARRTLESSGFSVLEATNGVEALETLRDTDKRVDVIVMDWNMPEMSGLEAAGHIRDIPAHVNTPLIMATSEHDSRREAYAKHSGVDVYLTKPYSAAQMIDAIQAARNSHS